MIRLLLLPLLSLSLSASVISDTDFITKVYQDLLNRTPASGDLAAFQTYLGTAGNTRQGMALVVLTSPEYRADLVSSYYDSYLHRPADAGAAVFESLLAGGSTDEQVQSEFLGSFEYFAGHGSDNAQFINGLYLDLLNRTPSSFEVVNNLTLLGSITRTQLAGVVLSSLEYDNILVNNYYNAYLNRPADPFGLNFFVPQLQGATTNEVVQSEILGGEEYSLAESTPEPATFAEASIGAAVLWMCARRQRQRSELSRL